jgi:hypothetical protein
MTIEELDKRLTKLELEVQAIKQLLTREPRAETPAERGARMRLEAELEAPTIEALAKRVFEQMGITGEFIGAEKLQALMAARGVKPEDNILSRDIIAARECSRPPLPKSEE